MSTYETTLTIVPLVIVTLGFPFLLYLTHKFWKLRQHFLISSRFPKITLCISYSMYIATTEVALGNYIVFTYNNDKEKAISSTLLYPLLTSLAQISIYLFCSVIVFRALLIYDRWCMMAYALENQAKIIFGHNELMQQKQQPQNYTYYCFGQTVAFFHPLLMWSVSILFIILFLMTCICAPLVVMHKVSNIFFIFIFIIILIIGFIVLFNGRKINEFVLFKRETYLIISLIFAQIFISQLSFIDERLLHFFGFMLATTGCYVILILSLSMVYKNEGSLLSVTTLKLRSPIVTSSTSSTSSISSPSNSDQIEVGTKATDKINALSLDNYLKSLDNYNQFGEFLGGCFALENLLFFAKIIVFRHTLLDIINAAAMKTDKIESENQSFECLDKWCPNKMEKVFALKFEYIDGLYDSLKSNKNTSVHNIAKNIYDQFISSEAVYEVNISAENRDFLTDFFNENVQKDKEDTVHGIEEYLTAFNGAIVEVYGILKSVYKFQYK